MEDQLSPAARTWFFTIGFSDEELDKAMDVIKNNPIEGAFDAKLLAVLIRQLTKRSP